MYIEINFVAFINIIKNLKNKALQIEVRGILQVIEDLIDSCNQQYEQNQNNTDEILTNGLTHIQTKLEELAKLIEQGNVQKSLVLTAMEKQQLHLIYLTLQQALPGNLKYTFHHLIQLKDESGTAFTPTRTLINHAARGVFKVFLKKEIKPFIQALGASRKVFISYAWANATFPSYHRDKVYEGMVIKLAHDLEMAGCNVFLDRWYDQAGKPLTEFLELMGQADCFVPIGTCLYLHKYNHRAEQVKSREHMVRAEGQILNYISTYNSESRNKIKPVLLEGTSEDTLPLLIRLNIPLMLHQSEYVSSFFRLIRSVYDIDNRDTEFKQLERKCYQALNALADKKTDELQQIISNNRANKEHQPHSKPKLWAGEIAKSSHFWHVPVLSANFMGRVELLSQLHAKLSSQGQQPVAITACHGLGGVGKTQLALKYAYDHRHEYSHIFWFSAESEEQLLLDYRALADKLQLSTERLLPQEIADQVKAWLERNSGWLLVYDNVSDAKLITQYRPCVGGKVIVTSRKQAWDKNQCLSIDVFNLDESREYITLLTGFTLNKYQKPIDTLAETLGYLPLALAQACAYIDANHISLEEYLQFYEANRIEMLADNTLPAEDNHEPAAVTWKITFKAIAAQYPSARLLLLSCAYLHADNIYEGILKSLFFTYSSNASEKKFIEILGCLQRYSILKQSNKSNAFNIHRLVQVILVDNSQQDFDQAFVQLEHVFNVLIIHLQDSTKQQDLFSHFKSALNHIGLIFKNDNSAKIARLLLTVLNTFILIFQKDEISDQFLDLSCSFINSLFKYIAVTNLNKLINLWASELKIWTKLFILVNYLNKLFCNYNSNKAKKLNNYLQDICEILLNTYALNNIKNEISQTLYHNSAILEFKLENYEVCKKKFETLISNNKLQNCQSVEKKSTIYANLAIIHLKNKNYQDSIFNFKKSIELLGNINSLKLIRYQFGADLAELLDNFHNEEINSNNYLPKGRIISKIIDDTVSIPELDKKGMLSELAFVLTAIGLNSQAHIVYEKLFKLSINKFEKVIFSINYACSLLNTKDKQKSFKVLEECLQSFNDKTNLEQLTKQQNIKILLSIASTINLFNEYDIRLTGLLFQIFKNSYSSLSIGIDNNQQFLKLKLAYNQLFLLTNLSIQDLDSIEKDIRDLIDYLVQDNPLNKLLIDAYVLQAQACEQRFYLLHEPKKNLEFLWRKRRPLALSSMEIKRIEIIYNQALDIAKEKENFNLNAIKLSKVDLYTRSNFFDKAEKVLREIRDDNSLNELEKKMIEEMLTDIKDLAVNNHFLYKILYLPCKSGQLFFNLAKYGSIQQYIGLGVSFIFSSIYPHWLGQTVGSCISDPLGAPLFLAFKYFVDSIFRNAIDISPLWLRTIVNIGTNEGLCWVVPHFSKEINRVWLQKIYVDSSNLIIPSKGKLTEEDQQRISAIANGKIEPTFRRDTFDFLYEFNDGYKIIISVSKEITIIRPNGLTSINTKNTIIHQNNPDSYFDKIVIDKKTGDQHLFKGKHILTINKDGYKITNSLNYYSPITFMLSQLLSLTSEPKDYSGKFIAKDFLSLEFEANFSKEFTELSGKLNKEQLIALKALSIDINNQCIQPSSNKAKKLNEEIKSNACKLLTDVRILSQLRNFAWPISEIASYEIMSKILQFTDARQQVGLEQFKSIVKYGLNRQTLGNNKYLFFSQCAITIASDSLKEENGFCCNSYSTCLI